MNPEAQGDSLVNSRTHKRTTARESPSSTRRGGSIHRFITIVFTF